MTKLESSFCSRLPPKSWNTPFFSLSLQTPFLLLWLHHRFLASVNTEQETATLAAISKASVLALLLLGFSQKWRMFLWIRQVLLATSVFLINKVDKLNKERPVSCNITSWTAADVALHQTTMLPTTHLRACIISTELHEQFLFEAFSKSMRSTGHEGI